MIRAEMKEWHTLTENMIRLLQIEEEEKRDLVIEQVELSLAKREELQSFIQQPFTEEEIEFGKKLILADQQLNKKLNVYMSAIKKDLSNTQVKKGTMHNYMNPYDKVARDGTYYDTKQ